MTKEPLQEKQQVSALSWIYKALRLLSCSGNLCSYLIISTLLLYLFKLQIFEPVSYFSFVIEFLASVDLLWSELHHILDNINMKIFS